MRIQYPLHSRSATGTGGGGGLGKNTIIFIVLGVVCLLVILIGFYLVSRPRAACSASPNIPNTHSEHSPTTHSPRPQCERDMSERWKIWKIWHRTNSAEPTIAPDIPPSHLSAPVLMITKTSRVSDTRDDSKTCPSIVHRPSQSRRVTSLSIATSFSHSHITEQALSELCASAYDLDGDLETEMLHSARDDVWLGHPLAVEDGYGNIVGETMEARGNVTPIVEGSVEGDASTRHTTRCEGGDYENLDACRSVAIGSNDAEGGVCEVDKVGQVFQCSLPVCPSIHDY